MIYVIRRKGSNYRKIGTAIDPKRRLKALQAASPEPLELEMTGRGAHRFEKGIHLKFAAYRVSGEWFDIPAEKIPELESAVRNSNRLIIRRCPECNKLRDENDMPKPGCLCLPCREKFRNRLVELGRLPATGKDVESEESHIAFQDHLNDFRFSGTLGICGSSSTVGADDDANGSWSRVVKAYEQEL